MNIIDLIPYIYVRLVVFVLVFTRISAFLSTFILFNRGVINSRILVGLAIMLSVMVILFKQDNGLSYDMFSLAMLLQAFFQFFIGFVSGLILNITFEIFTAIGQIISTQTGLALASVIDPKLGNITNLTQFYMYTALLIIFFMNGHLLVIQTMVESFSVLPAGKYFALNELISGVLGYAGVIFSASILLSITVSIAVLIANFALALMSKFAPQFNLFSIGINITLLLGLMCVYLTFNLFVEKGAGLIQAGMDFLQTALGQLKLHGR